MTLVFIEHDGQNAKRAALGAIELARRLGGPFSLAILGHGLDSVAESIQNLGALKILIADHAALAEPLADKYAFVLARMARHCQATSLIGVSSTLTKDILPRAAALLDAAMLTDVIDVEGQGSDLRFVRPLLAGSLLATVMIEGPLKVLAAKNAAFSTPSTVAERSPVDSIAIDPLALPDGMTWVQRELPSSQRPDLGEARVVVSGGRPLKDRETFDRLIGGLADALGGAVAATRAAVDTGMAPNELQVGQTGRSIAPELYVAVGVSGAIQHMAGVKDSKIIVAINRDPDAPVFQSATYGLVGDLFQIVPEMITCLGKR